MHIISLLLLLLSSSVVEQVAAQHFPVPDCSNECFGKEVPQLCPGLSGPDQLRPCLCQEDTAHRLRVALRSCLAKTSTCTTKEANQAKLWTYTACNPNNKYFSDDDSSDGLSTGAQAGIGVAVAMIVLIIVGVAGWCLLKRRRQRQQEQKKHEQRHEQEQKEKQQIQQQQHQYIYPHQQVQMSPVQQASPYQLDQRNAEGQNFGRAELENSETNNYYQGDAGVYAPQKEEPPAYIYDTGAMPAGSPVATHVEHQPASAVYELPSPPNQTARFSYEVLSPTGKSNDEKSPNLTDSTLHA